MTAPIVLLAQERSSGRERLTVRWVPTDGGAHRLDIAIERRNDDEWVRAYGISASPGEVFRLHDAIGEATYLARRVSR